MLKIYVLKTKQYYDYNSFDCQVIVAENEQIAREMCQHADEGDIWKDETLVECIEIGIAHSPISKGIHCSSFNAS